MGKRTTPAQKRGKQSHSTQRCSSDSPDNHNIILSSSTHLGVDSKLLLWHSILGMEDIHDKTGYIWLLPEKAPLLWFVALQQQQFPVYFWVLSKIHLSQYLSYLFKATGLSLRHGGEAELTETKYEIMPPSSGHCADGAWLPSNIYIYIYIYIFRRTSSYWATERRIVFRFQKMPGIDVSSLSSSYIVCCIWISPLKGRGQSTESTVLFLIHCCNRKEKLSWKSMNCCLV